MRRLDERKVAREDLFEERFLRRFGDGAEGFLLGLVLDQCVALQRGQNGLSAPVARGERTLSRVVATSHVAGTVPARATLEDR